jgi:surface antigen
MRRGTTFLLVLILAAMSVPSFADPPAHAPAHGWRKKHDPYVGPSGNQWEEDYEVSSGRCNREEIGAVIGAVAGGVVGSKIASPENRVVGVVIGAIAGTLVGARIGRELDAGDRGCFGHALEIARPGDRVLWDNRATGVSYSVIPGVARREGSSLCRDFVMVASTGKEKNKRTGRACQSSRGVWSVM